MASDDYQLMSKKEVRKLQDELKKVREGPAAPATATMESLEQAMHELISVLKEASRELREDDEEANLTKKMDELATKLDVIIEQNEKIAEGLVSVADMIKEASSTAPMKEPERTIPTEPWQSAPQQMQQMPSFPQMNMNPQPMGMPQMGSNMGQPMGMPSMGGGLPPSPPPPPRKRQFPSFFK